MKNSKQSPKETLVKACKTDQYKKLIIAFISTIIWLSTIATSFASNNINTLEEINYTASQSPVENIVPSQLIFQETTNLIADATSWDDQSDFFQKDPLIGILQDFQKSWQPPNIKQNLFNVCQETEAVDESTCLDLLKKEIKIKKKQLIDSCYGTPGSNGQLCLDVNLKTLGIKLSDFGKWIDELDGRERGSIGVSRS